MAYNKEELILQAGGVVRDFADLLAKALDLRRPGLLSRTEANPEAGTPEIFLLPPFGDGFAMSGGCKKVPSEAKP